MKHKVKFYKVGGCVRDSFLGISSKDIDYSVEASSFEEMRDAIIKKGGTIYLETPQYFTIRAKLNGEDADFTLCRKEGVYKDGRHPSSVQISSIYSDLSRRDATCNAIAISENGEVIDPFGGIEHIKNKILVAVGNPSNRIQEDGLRLLRYIRFSITKGFALDYRLVNFLRLDLPIIRNPLLDVSTERVKEELQKCFVYDTKKTLIAFRLFDLEDYIFEAHPKLKLTPTLKSS